MLTGKPWPGVRLLVSNGREVIGEGTTDAHGVFRKNYKDLPANASFVPAETAPPVNAPPSGTVPAVEPQPAPARRRRRACACRQPRPRTAPRLPHRTRSTPMHTPTRHSPGDDPFDAARLRLADAQPRRESECAIRSAQSPAQAAVAASQPVAPPQATGRAARRAAQFQRHPRLRRDRATTSPRTCSTSRASAWPRG